MNKFEEDEFEEFRKSQNYIYRDENFGRHLYKVEDLKKSFTAGQQTVLPGIIGLVVRCENDAEKYEDRHDMEGTHMMRWFTHQLKAIINWKDRGLDGTRNTGGNQGPPAMEQQEWETTGQ